jgi:hypothetical protein
LLKKLLKDATNIAMRSPLNCEPSKKRARVCPTIISGFFCIPSKFKKDDATQIGVLEDLMLFVVKGGHLNTMIKEPMYTLPGIY